MNTSAVILTALPIATLLSAYWLTCQLTAGVTSLVQRVRSTAESGAIHSAPPAPVSFEEYSA